jgi:pyridoxamine 5'-phosphate oxidase family protein
MPFTQEEIDYLKSQKLGRLATVQPDGTLQVSPLGFGLNAETGTIDIGGYNMARSWKFRNIADNGRVSFVVDDLASVDPWRVRCLEIRGYGEAMEVPEGSSANFGGPVIRIHPKRVISSGIDDTDTEPHKLVANNRNVG